MSSTLTRGWFAYVSDDGNTYQVATTLVNGVTVNGGSVVAPGANPTYPRGWKMRFIYGFDASTKKRTKVPMLSPSATLYVNGGSFAKDGGSFDVEGRIGEHMTNRGG